MSTDYHDLNADDRTSFDQWLLRAMAANTVTPIEFTPAHRQPMDVTVCITLDGAEQEALQRRLDGLHQLSPNRPHSVTPDMVSLWVYDAIQRVLDELKAAELSEGELRDHD